MEIIAYCFFDITLNFLKKNMYANLLTRCDDTCVITPYLFIYLCTGTTNANFHSTGMQPLTSDIDLIEQHC